jgi:hypothetical protein
MPKTYTEKVTLPKELSPADVEAIWRFVLARSGRGVVSRQAKVWTEQGTLSKEQSLDEAIAALDAGQQVSSLWATASNRNADNVISLDWNPKYSTFRTINVSTTDQTRTLGVAEATRRFIGDRVYADALARPSTAAPTDHGLRSWLHGLSIEVVGGLVVLGIAGLVTVIWAVLR